MPQEFAVRNSSGTQFSVGRRDACLRGKGCANVAKMATTEHILLESDFREVPDPRTPKNVHYRAVFRSRLRRRVLQFEIIDYYYLAVRSNLLEYVLDLRILERPRLSRHTAWRWIKAALVSTGLLAFGIWVRIRFPGATWWTHHWLSVCAIVAGVAAVTTLVAAYRTTETVTLESLYGEAKLLEFTGGLGTFRRLRGFLSKLAAHIQLASRARRRTKAEHLRDEMREHQRLKEIGVLSTEDYETSKARILKQHAPVARSPRAT